LDHDVVLAVDQVRPRFLDILGSNVLDNKHGLFGLDGLNLHQDTALPEACNFRVFIHVLAVLSTVAKRSPVDVLPEKCAIFKADDVLSIQIKRADHVIRKLIFVPDFEAQAPAHYGQLCGNQEFLVPVDLAPFLLDEDFRLELFGLVLKTDVGVDFGFLEQRCIHRHDFLGAEESNVQLVKLWLNLRRLDNFFLMRMWVLTDCDLGVALSADRDAQFKVAGDLAEVIALGVAHGDPLVHHGVVLHQVDVAQIEFVKADHRVFEKAFVQQAYLNLAALHLLSFHVLGFEENMLLPVGLGCVIDTLLGSSVFALSKARYLDHGVDGIAWFDEETFGLLNEDVDHVVSTLHGHHGLVVLLLLLLVFFFVLFDLFLLVAHSVSCNYNYRRTNTT